MRSDTMFRVFAKLTGAFAAALLLLPAATMDAQAQNPTAEFTYTKSPADGTTTGPLFQVSYQFLVQDDLDDDGTDDDVPVAVTGVTNSNIDITTTDVDTDGNSLDAGTVQSITPGTVANDYTYTIRVRAGAGVDDVTVGFKDESITRTYTRTDTDPNDPAVITDYNNGVSGAENISVNIDQVGPSLTLALQDENAATLTSPFDDDIFQVNITVSEDAVGFTSADMTVSGASVTSFTGTGTTRIAVFNSNVADGGEGDITIRFPARRFADALGNFNAEQTLTVRNDKKHPTVSLVSPAANSVYGAGAVRFRVKFSEALTADPTFTANTYDDDDDDTTAEVTTLASGTSVVVTAVTGSTTDYYVDITPRSDMPANTPVGLLLAADAVSDAAGNTNAAATLPTVRINALIPVATFHDQGGVNPMPDVYDESSPLDDDDNFTITIKFNKNVIGFALGDVTVTNGVVNTISGALPGAEFVVEIDPTDDYEGPLTVTIPAGAALSAAADRTGNIVQSRTANIRRDIPTLEWDAPQGTRPGTFTADISASEDVTGLTIDDISVSMDPSGVATLGSLVVNDDADGDGYAQSWTLTVMTPTDPVPGATVVLQIASNAATDRVASATGAETVEARILIDFVAPTLSVTSVGSASEGFEALLDFSEEVNGFTLSDIMVVADNGQRGTASELSPVEDDDDSYTVKITPPSAFSGRLFIYLADGSVTDDAGNAFEAVDAADRYAVLIDRDIPALKTTGDVGESVTEVPTVASTAFMMDLVFTEEVTGLDTDDFEISTTDGDLPDATVTAVTGSLQSYSVTVTPRVAAAADDFATHGDESVGFTGDMTIRLKADAVTDSTGNNNLVGGVYTIEVNLTPPTVEVTGPELVNGTFDVTFTFDKPVRGLEAGDITSTGADVDDPNDPNDTFVGLTVSPEVGLTDTPVAVYTVTVPLEDNAETVTLGIAANAVTDIYGNSNEAAAGLFMTSLDTDAPWFEFPSTIPQGVGTVPSFSDDESIRVRMQFLNEIDDLVGERITGLDGRDFVFQWVDYGFTDYGPDGETGIDPGPDGQLSGVGAGPDGFLAGFGPGPDGVLGTADDVDYSLDNIDYSLDNIDRNLDDTIYGEYTAPAHGAVVERIELVAATVGSEEGFVYDVTFNPPTPSLAPVSRDHVNVVYDLDEDGIDDRDYIGTLRISLPESGGAVDIGVTDIAGNSAVVSAAGPDGLPGTGDELVISMDVEIDPNVVRVQMDVSTSNDPYDWNTDQRAAVHTTQDDVWVRARFNQEVLVFDVTDFTLGAATNTSAAIEDFTGSADGATYTAKITGFDTDGTVTITIPENFNNLANIAVVRTIVLDTEAPEATALDGPFAKMEEATTVLDTGDEGNSAKLDGSRLWYRATFNEGVEGANAGADGLKGITGVTASTLTVENGTVVSVSAEQKAAGAGDDGDLAAADDNETLSAWWFEVAPTPLRGSGDVTVSLELGGLDTLPGVTDYSGNAVSVISATPVTVTVDTLAPTPLILFSADRMKDHNRISGINNEFDVYLTFQSGNLVDPETEEPILEAGLGDTDGIHLTGDDALVETDFMVWSSGDNAAFPTYDENGNVERYASLTVEDYLSVDTNVNFMRWPLTITLLDMDPGTEDGEELYFEGTLNISLKAGKVKDVIGHENTASAALQVFVDRTTPKLLGIEAPFVAGELGTSIPGGFTGESYEFQAKFVFDEVLEPYPDPVLEAPDFQRATGNFSTAMTGVPTEGAFDSLAVVDLGLDPDDPMKAVVTYRATTLTTATAVTLGAIANAAFDIAGVGYEVPEDENLVITSEFPVDRTRPTIVIKEAADQEDAEGDEIIFEFTSNKSLSLVPLDDYADAPFTADDIEVMNGSLKAGSFSGPTVDTTDPSAVKYIYMATITPNFLGDLMVTLDNGAASTSAGNLSYRVTYTKDLGRPMAEMVIVAYDADSSSWVEANGTQNGPFWIDLRFAEEMLDAMFTDVNPITLDLTSGSGTQLGHNPNALDSDATDREDPNAVTDAVLAGTIGAGETGGGRWVDRYNIASSGTVHASIYRTRITPSATFRGDMSIVLSEGLTADISGNMNLLSKLVVPIDMTPPTLMVSPDDVGNNVNNSNIFPVTLEFSEPIFFYNDGIVDPTEAAFTVTGGVIVPGTLRMTTPNDPTPGAVYYTFDINPDSGVASIIINMTAGYAFWDDADNVAVLDGIDVNDDGILDPEDTEAVFPHTIVVDTVMPTPVLTGPAEVSGGFTLTIMFYDITLDANGAETARVEERVDDGTVDMSDITVTGGTARKLRKLTDSTYAADILVAAGAESVMVDIASGVLMDTAGNVNAAAAQFTTTVNMDRPSVSIDAPDYENGEFTIAVDFGVAVTGFTEADITIIGGANGGYVRTGSITSTVDDPGRYELNIVPTPDTDGSIEGELGISVPENSVTVSGGTDQNTVSVTAYVDIDTTQPTATGLELNNGNPLAYNQYEFTAVVTFSEDVDRSSFALGDLTFATSGRAVRLLSATDDIYPDNLNYPDSIGVQTLASNQVGAVISTATQDEEISLGIGRVNDLAGNSNSTSVSRVITIDRDRPGVTVSVVDGNLGPRNLEPFQVRFAFSIPVGVLDGDAFTMSEVTVTNAAVSDFVEVSTQIYTAVITPNANATGSVTIRVLENVVNGRNDDPAKGNTASNTLTVNVGLGRTKVNISSAASAPVTGPFNIVVEFTSAVSGFSSSDITVESGTVSGNPTLLGPGRYNVGITPAGPVVRILVSAGVVSPANDASNVFTITTSGIDAPEPAGLVAALTGPTDAPLGPVAVNVQFTRGGSAVAVTQLDMAEDFSVTPADAASLTSLVPHATDTGRYTLTITPADGFEGALTVTLAGDDPNNDADNNNGAEDDLGNHNREASYIVTIDLTAPTAALAGPDAVVSAAFTVSLTFTEDVTGLESSDLAVVNGTAGDPTGSGTAYQVMVTPDEGFDGELTVSLSADAVEDAAGNMNPMSDAFSVMVDQTAPTAAVTGPDSPHRNEPIMVSIMFSEAVTGLEASGIVASSGMASDLMADAETEGLYTATVTPDSEFQGTLMVSVAEGAAMDAAGNGNVASEAYSVEVYVETSFTLRLDAGLNMIHIPVNDPELAQISDLYEALGGSSDVLYILALDADGDFAAYTGIPGSAADLDLSDQTGLIVNMASAKDVTFSGAFLSDMVELNAGINLIGVPRSGAVAMASEVAPDDLTLVLTRTDSGDAQFQLVVPGMDSDIPVTGGQGFIVVSTEAAMLLFPGDPWSDPEGSSEAASARAVRFDPTSTAAFLVEGTFVREDTLEPINGLEVTVTNLRTGQELIDRVGLTAGSGRMSAPMLDLQGGQYHVGDRFEVVVRDPSGTFGGLIPIQVTVGKEEISSGRIALGQQLLSAVPERSALLPNYPNPFNPETWIPFDLSESSRVQVMVYNAAGQMVRTLDLGQLPAGQYRSRSKAAYWDGRNALGERVSSGLYFYRIEAGSFSSMRRMVILK